MFKFKKLLLLTSVMCLGLLNVKPMTVYASDYKLTVDNGTKLDNTINSIKLNSVKLEMGEQSPFAIRDISVGSYYVVTKSGEKVCNISITEDVDDITSKIINCEKSTFISENVTITDIVHNDVENGTVTSCKKNDRKCVVFTDGSNYVELNSLSTDEVIYGNNYINKVLDNINVSFSGE